MRSTKEIFGDNLRSRRKELGITQRRLAELTGLTVQGINRIEKGKRQARESTIKILIEALDCTEQELSADKSQQTPTVDSLLEALAQLQKENQALKSLPQDLITAWSTAHPADQDTALKILQSHPRPEALPKAKKQV